jgi:hypothetical protein
MGVFLWMEVERVGKGRVGEKVKGQAAAGLRSISLRAVQAVQAVGE